MLGVVDDLVDVDDEVDVGVAAFHDAVVVFAPGGAVRLMVSSTATGGYNCAAERRAGQTAAAVLPTGHPKTATSAATRETSVGELVRRWSGLARHLQPPLPPSPHLTPLQPVLLLLLLLVPLPLALPMFVVVPLPPSPPPHCSFATLFIRLWY